MCLLCFSRSAAPHSPWSSRRGFVLSAGALLVSPVVAQSPAPAPLMPNQISASAWYVEGQLALGSSANQNFVSNAGFVITRDAVVVIDALGSPPLARQLLAAIRLLTDKPVSHVIVTHYHADHIYGLQSFKAVGARVLAHQAVREYLNSDTARLRLEASRAELAPWIDGDTQLIAADEWLIAGRTLEVGKVRFDILPVGPSHTPEDLVIYLPQEKVLFAGDLVFRNRIPFVGQADSRQWIKALDALLAFDTSAIVPGHGPVSTEARRDTELTRDYLTYLRSVMGAAAKNLDSFDEAYQAADWSRFQNLPLFRLANRMNAYNTYLLMEREAR